MCAHLLRQTSACGSAARSTPVIPRQRKEAASADRRRCAVLCERGPHTLKTSRRLQPASSSHSLHTVLLIVIAPHTSETNLPGQSSVGSQHLPSLTRTHRALPSRALAHCRSSHARAASTAKDARTAYWQRRAALLPRPRGVCRGVEWRDDGRLTTGTPRRSLACRNGRADR